MATKTKEKPKTELVPVKDLQKGISDLQKTAAGMRVSNNDEYEVAAEFLKAVKLFRSQVEERFAEPKASAWATHKAITKLEKETLEGPREAEAMVTRKVTAYLDEQEKKRLEEERKLEAQRLKEEGKNRQAEQVLSGKREVTGTTVESSVPKVEGLTTRQNWKFRIVDATKIPREYLIPDETKIGQMVRTMKGDTSIPGVEAYAETSLVNR